MMHKLVLFFLIGALSGCVSFRQMDRGLNALNGQPINTAFSVIGYPAGKQTFGSDVVYYWGRSSTEVMFMPQTVNTYGSVGSTPYYGSTMHNQAIPVNYTCDLKIITDENGIIKTWEYDGNIGGCERYIRQLDTYYKRITE
jgi:hypothetical protein